MLMLSLAIIPCTAGVLLDAAAMAIERVDQVAKGNIDLSKLPGFSEAAQAAAAEGQQVPAPSPGMVAPNPADWSQGVPP